MDEERLSAAVGVAVNLFYCLALTVMVLAAVPSLRLRLAALGANQARAWRYGRWLATQTPTPRWTELLSREDLPQERQV